MSTHTIDRQSSTATVVPETWGTATYFARLARVDQGTSIYWVTRVARRAHKLGHPFLSIAGCPGCLFERAGAA